MWVVLAERPGEDRGDYVVYRPDSDGLDWGIAEQLLDGWQLVCGARIASLALSNRCDCGHRSRGPGQARANSTTWWAAVDSNHLPPR
jgi:hypothetical protein